MAQDPWANDPVVPIRSRDSRQNEREQAETRYRNVTGDTNPLAQPVILPGEEGYVGTRGQYLPQADVVVAGPWESDPVVEAPIADQSGFGAFGSFAQSAAEQIPFLDEAAAFTLAKLNGIPYEEARALQAGLAQDDRQNQPFARNAGGVAGFAAGLAAPGNAYVRGAQGAGRVGRAALVGAGYGGLYGSGAADDSYASRLTGGAIGALVGGVGAGTIQAVTPYASRLAGIAGDAIRSAVPSGVARRAVERSGNVEGAAAMRLAGNLGPDQIAERQRLQSLGLQPTVLDTLDNTGERVIRMAAGPAGPGAEAAVQNLVTRQASLKPEVMSVTRGLSPDARTASQVSESLADTRSRLASEQYAPAYGAPVEITDSLLSALSDAPGLAALRRARQAAVARRDGTQVGEIDDLLARVSERSQPIVLENRSLPSSSSLATPPIPTVEEMRAFGSVERVPLRSARRSQSWMDWDRVNSGERPGDMVQGYGDKPLAVRREDGEFIILDGHHRTVRAAESGQQDLEMYVINARDYAPDVAGVRPRPSNRAEDDALLRELGVEPSPRVETSRPTTVSAGTLDRVRIAMNNRAEALGRNATGARDVAGGLRGRASDIDATLESVPELAPARETYRNLSGAIDAIENRPDVFSTDPRDFAGWVRNLTPEQRDAAIIGVRQDILDQLGGQRNAGTGSLDTLSQAQYSQANLASLLGEEQAAQYLGSIRARVQQAQRASRVSPNTGSQTYGRVEDDANAAANIISTLVDGVGAVRGSPMAVGRLVDRARASLTMSPQEREAVVRLGLGSADEIERIIQLAADARRSGRRPPREVRAWVVNTRNVLGADNPVTLQVERLLAPPTAAAQEED